MLDFAVPGHAEYGDSVLRPSTIDAIDMALPVWSDPLVTAPLRDATFRVTPATIFTCNTRAA